MKSRSTEDDFLVRAVAHAFFDSEDGLQECAAGYLLAPVSYSAVAWHIRHNTDLSFDDDFDNWYLNEDGVDEQLSDDCSAPPPQTYPVDEGNDMPDLTSLLEGDEECQRFFIILRSPNSNLQILRESQPYVTADLHALIHGYQLQRVQDIMPRVHALVVHPEDPAYQAEFNRLATTPRS